MSQETINFSLTVNPSIPPPPALVLVDGNGNPLADGANVPLQPETVGVADPGQKLFTVSGGTPPYNYALGSGALPAGDAISSVENSDGSETLSIGGTPTAPTPAGTPATFAITVSDSAPAPATQRKTVKIG